jgi:hypothetical protein
MGSRALMRSWVALIPLRDSNEPPIAAATKRERSPGAVVRTALLAESARVAALDRGRPKMSSAGP